jgi:hypothetical protein
MHRYSLVFSTNAKALLLKLSQRFITSQTYRYILCSLCYKKHSRWGEKQYEKRNKIRYPIISNFAKRNNNFLIPPTSNLISAFFLSAPTLSLRLLPFQNVHASQNFRRSVLSNKLAPPETDFQQQVSVYEYLFDLGHYP